MTPRTKKSASIVGIVLFMITVIGFSAGAAKGIFDAGASVQAVQSKVETQADRLARVELSLGGKADVDDVKASEARIKEALSVATQQLREDIRELRTPRRR